MTDPVTEKIIQIFKEVLPDLKEGELELSASQETVVGWDSFAHMELVGKIEQAFGVTFELDEVITLETPQAFVDIVEKKQQT